MRIKSHMAAQALDGFDAVGLDRDELLTAVGLDANTVADPRAYIEWTTFVALLDLGWTKLGRDVERMRLVGRAVARAPSYVLLQRLARTVVSVKRIYDVGTRWGSPAALPHILLEQETVSERRLRFRGTIPEPHAPSIAIQHLFEGILAEVPTLIGLPPATIVSSRVTPRTIDVVIDLPSSPSIGARLRRAFRRVFSASEAVDLLEAQRRELADALVEQQRANAETRDLLDRLPDHVLIHRDGVILWMNRANLRSLGYERSEEVAGRPVLDVVDPASRDLIRSRMRQPVGGYEEVNEIRLAARDGRIVVLEVSPAQTVIFEGKPARLVAGRDITERVRMQQQLLIADRMASIGMLAAGVAHEVNNPLAYVLNNIEIAKKGLAPEGEAASESRNALDVALEGVARIRNIVHDLLALSRVHDDAIGPVDVLAVVESTLALAASEIGKRAVLSFEHEPTAPAAGTVARLGQVLLNLVANALESMPSDTRADNQLRVMIRSSSTGGAVIEVSDNGVGIPAEHTARIFEPFFTTKAPGRGTGLGLAIGQRLVTEMGGHMSFESTPPHGSTFRVTLAPWEPIRDASS
ncbi:MAG: two-component system sensor histidine kinase NtrB [Polyangiales bacterium]